MKTESRPLVYFVLAAVVATIALLFAVGDRLRPTPQIAETPEAATGQASEQANSDTGEPAAQTPAPEPAQRAEQPAEPAEPAQPEPATEMAPAKTPSFDIVRVEEGGAAVIAGQAEPGAEILLNLDGKTIGTAIANARGEWVVTPLQPLPKGDHDLMIVSKNPAGEVVQSEQMVAVSVPESDEEQPLVVMSQPAQPSQVLQTPQAAAETQVAAADSAQPEPAEQAPAGDQPAAAAAVEAAPQPEAAPAAPTAALAMNSVDYNDAGDILFSGKAAPGETVRVYVDNTHVGDAVADAAGNWVFRGEENIRPGVHSLRIDQIGAGGQVVQRRELPFERAEPARVAELHQSQTGDVAAAQPEPSDEPSAERSVAATAEPSAEPSVEPAVEPSAEPSVEPAQDEQPAPAGQTASADTATAGEQPATAAAPKVGRVVIQPGNNLWNISRVIYGRGVEYSVIYEANKDQIRNPHRIYPGQIFTTPGVVPPSEIDPERREPMGEAGATEENG